MGNERERTDRSIFMTRLGDFRCSSSCFDNGGNRMMCTSMSKSNIFTGFLGSFFIQALAIFSFTFFIARSIQLEENELTLLM